MGSKKFTFIELHLDGDTQFGPRSIGEALPMLGSDVDVETDREEETAAAAEEDESGGRPVAAIVGLLALVGVALAVRKFRGGDDEPEETDLHDEPDVVVN